MYVGGGGIIPDEACEVYKDSRLFGGAYRIAEEYVEQLKKI